MAHTMLHTTMPAAHRMENPQSAAHHSIRSSAHYRGGQCCTITYPTAGMLIMGLLTLTKISKSCVGRRVLLARRLASTNANDFSKDSCPRMDAYRKDDSRGSDAAST